MKLTTWSPWIRQPWLTVSSCNATAAWDHKTAATRQCLVTTLCSLWPFDLDLWPSIHWWAKYSAGLSLCQVWWLGLSRCGFIVRTDTDRQNHRGGWSSDHPPLWFSNEISQRPTRPKSKNSVYQVRKLLSQTAKSCRHSMQVANMYSCSQATHLAVDSQDCHQVYESTS